NGWFTNVSNALHAIQRPAEWLIPPGPGIDFSSLIAVRDKLGIHFQQPATYGEEMLKAWAAGHVYLDSLEGPIDRWTARLPHREDVAEITTQFVKALDDRISTVVTSQPDSRAIVTSAFEGRLGSYVLSESRMLRLLPVSCLPDGNPLKLLKPDECYSLPTR